MRIAIDRIVLVVGLFERGVVRGQRAAPFSVEQPVRERLRALFVNSENQLVRK